MEEKKKHLLLFPDSQVRTYGLPGAPPCVPLERYRPKKVPLSEETQAMINAVKERIRKNREEELRRKNEARERNL